MLTMLGCGFIGNIIIFIDGPCMTAGSLKVSNLILTSQGVAVSGRKRYNVSDSGGAPHRLRTMVNTIARILDIAPERARLVAGYLRDDHRALDALSPGYIAEMYLTEIKDCIDADPTLADKVAASYGFLPLAEG